MRALLTVVSSVVIAVGYLQFGMEAGLLMWITSEGASVYPVSSGSEDRHLLAVAFLAYLLTLVASLGSYALKKKVGAEKATYWVNLSFLAVVVFLVELDSSIVGSALGGDWVPLAGIAFAALPLPFLLWAGRRKAMCAGGEHPSSRS